MRISLIISFIVHASILVAAVVVLPDPSEYAVEPEASIPVEIIEFSDLSQRVATKKEPQPEPVEKPLPPKVEKVEKVEKPKPAVEPAPEIKEAVKEPQPEPEPVPVKQEPEPPQPDPLKELIKKAEKLPEPEPQPEKAKPDVSPVPVPRVKPKVPKSFKLAQKKKKKKKHKFNPNDISALLNKIDDEPKTSPQDIPDETGTPASGEIDNLLGEDLKLTGSEADWLRQKVQQCWSPPVGVRGAERLVVKVGFQLDISGTVLGTPRVLNSSGDPLFGVAANAAVRAVLGCQPYDGLPPEKFQFWSNNIVNFDPSRMLGVN